MPVEILTGSGRVASERLPGIVEPAEEDSLRTLALERIRRRRRFHLHLLALAVGLPILGSVWVLTEYFEERTWPSVFASDPDVAGTWDPWFFFVAGIWLVLLAAHALRTYFGPPVGPIGRWLRRPVPEQELDRELERLESRR